MKEAGSIIALLCVSWLTCSTALVHKRTQTQVNASSAVAGQQSWSPQVHAYIRHLEDIENGISLVETQKQIRVSGVSGSGRRPDAKANAFPQHNGSGTVLFIVLSDSYHYESNLRYISETWGKDLPASQLMAIGDGGQAVYGQDNSLVGGMQVQATQCPAHSHDGACCKMGEAIINAQRVLKGRPDLKWAYISDDDAYVRPAAVEERFEHVDTRGTIDGTAVPGVFGSIIGIGRCRSGTCHEGGMCGGGGIALSREALETLVRDSPSTFLKKHMQMCNRCANNGALYGDAAIGQQAYESGISLTEVGGLNAWGMNKTAFDASLSAPEEPLIYHYQRHEAQFLFLHQLFSPSGNIQTNSLLNLADKRLQSNLDGSQESQDKCATFKGNTQCWSGELPAGEHDFPDGPPWLGTKAIFPD